MERKKERPTAVSRASWEGCYYFISVFLTMCVCMGARVHMCVCVRARAGVYVCVHMYVLGGGRIDYRECLDSQHSRWKLLLI